MTTQEHLAAIVRHIDKLLAIAEKRTSGEWIYDPDNSKGGSVKYSNAPQMVWGPKGPGYGTVAQTCSDGLTPYPSGQQAKDAAFIAACAGNAEAGWRATKHAAEWLGFMIETGEEFRVRGLIDTILAAWPVELLKEGEV